MVRRLEGLLRLLYDRLSVFTRPHRRLYRHDLLRIQVLQLSLRVRQRIFLAHEALVKLVMPVELHWVLVFRLDFALFIVGIVSVLLIIMLPILLIMVLLRLHGLVLLEQ